MESRDLINLLAGSDAARERSAMLCHVAEVGRQVDIASLDANIDGYAIKARAAGHVHPMAELSVRRKVIKELVDGGALEEIRNRGGEVCGWRMTPEAVNHHVSVVASGWVEEKDAPAWIVALAQRAT
jgi:hypothetical protein